MRPRAEVTRHPYIERRIPLMPLFREVERLDEEGRPFRAYVGQRLTIAAREALGWTSVFGRSSAGHVLSPNGTVALIDASIWGSMEDDEKERCRRYHSEVHVFEFDRFTPEDEEDPFI